MAVCTELAASACVAREWLLVVTVFSIVVIADS